MTVKTAGGTVMALRLDLSVPSPAAVIIIQIVRLPVLPVLLR
ncbi:hypothetical protein [uncultured Parasphingorhabdus sp.]